MGDLSGGFIAVDWGTTNRRAYLLDEAGVMVAEMEDDIGVTSVQPGQFEQALAAIKDALGDWPMLLAGMVGSNRGWREAPYVSCPAGLPEVAEHLLWIEDRPIAIVPGLSIVAGQHADVMRGEEVQLFGLSCIDRTVGNATVCHPGTHTKWVTMQGATVTGFTTAMTGELFGLLREHSILAPLLRTEVALGEPFLAAVETAFHGAALSAELFSIRAKVLLAQMDDRDASSCASGLLIGCDLRAGLKRADDKVIVVLGRPSLTRLYSAALTRCGWLPREADGAEAFVAGMKRIWEHVR